MIKVVVIIQEITSTIGDVPIVTNLQLRVLYSIQVGPNLCNVFPIAKIVYNFNDAVPSDI